MCRYAWTEFKYAKYEAASTFKGEIWARADRESESSSVHEPGVP
jgi:hypothetical protein